MMPIRSISLEFDKPKSMSRQQLEAAWLGAIWERPASCRKKGMGGIERDMFQDPTLFDLGLDIWLSDLEDGKEESPEMFEIFQKHGKSIGSFEDFRLLGGFMPFYFSEYAREIRMRSFNVVPPWM